MNGKLVKVMFLIIFLAGVFSSRFKTQLIEAEYPAIDTNGLICLYDILYIDPYKTVVETGTSFNVTIMFCYGFEIDGRFDGSFSLGWNETLLSLENVQSLYDNPIITGGMSGISVDYNPSVLPLPSSGILLVSFVTHGVGSVTLHFSGLSCVSEDGSVRIVSRDPVHNLDTKLNYTTIQEAIDAPETLDGHMIVVDERIYIENVNVSKSLSIKSENNQPEEATVQAANSSLPVFNINADYVNISGFTVKDAFSYIRSTPITSVAAVLVRIGGIQLYDSHHCNISNNICRNNSIGIHLLHSENNAVNDNKLLENEGVSSVGESGYGIYLNWWSHRNIAEKNICTHNGIGIGLHNSMNNIIKENFCLDNSVGVSLYSSQSSEPNVVKDNVILRNILSFNEEGIKIYVSFGNMIKENLLFNNIRGIAYHKPSDFILHNNFVNNTEQVTTITYGTSRPNKWDNGYPSGGNYWSDYNGTDSDNDGIGDTSYSIDADNTDNYPLVGMFSSFRADSEHHVQSICNSSISDFQYNGTAISFNVSGENDTAGFCRMCIPKAFMNDTFRVFVNGTEILPFPEPLPCSNSTHNYIYFDYTHSEQEVVIIPEFPSYIVLPLFMITTLLAVIVHRRKRTH